MANFFGKEDAVMRALAKVKDFDPHDLRRTASTWANATCPSPWVDWLLDHEIGGFARTCNHYAYVELRGRSHEAPTHTAQHRPSALCPRRSGHRTR
jgi:hypothetical protein